MTTRFAAQFSRHAASNLIRQFGDAITYLPRSGAPRSIDATISRGLDVGEDGVIVRGMVLTVLDDSTDGITATEIDTGGDAVQVPLQVGEAPQTLQIVHVLSSENGLVRFAVQ